MKEVVFTMERAYVPPFLFFVQREFGVDTTVNCTVYRLLCRHLGINPDYLSHRIQTIFLNGKPVDDVEVAVVRDGDRLTLSAAMPGLLGAVLRKAGYYAAMRSSISHREEAVNLSGGKGRVYLKLLNLVMGELGYYFLHRGMWVRGRDLHTFLKDYGAGVVEGCSGLTIDGEECDCSLVFPWRYDDHEVWLQVSGSGISSGVSSGVTHSR